MRRSIGTRPLRAPPSCQRSSMDNSLTLFANPNRLVPKHTREASLGDQISVLRVIEHDRCQRELSLRLCSVHNTHHDRTAVHPFAWSPKLNVSYRDTCSVAGPWTRAHTETDINALQRGKKVDRAPTACLKAPGLAPLTARSPISGGGVEKHPHWLASR